MQNYDVQGIAKRGQWFAVMRPNGRIGRVCFGSKYRAAEHASNSYKARWPDLMERGFRINAA